MKFVIRKIIFFLIILIPFWSFLVWFFYPKTVLSGLILDKTVLTRQGDEHRSLNWILTHNKIVKPNGSQYDISEDYYGFFPINRPEYVVRDLSFFNNEQLDSLSDMHDFLYYTDAYGIYTNEWVYGRDINERSRLVYGGLSTESYEFFKKMYQKRKLTITEFNNLASPTSLDLRFKMSRMLEVDFTGWTGRYFHSLDTLKNPDIPNWMKRLHLRYYGRVFDYDDIPGIVLIHESERILVLQDGIDLVSDVPIINTPENVQERFGIPAYVRFPYWFDVTFAIDTSDIYATYKIHTNERGDSILGSQNLPSEFPAIIGDSEENLRYYFCGDWADNPVPFGLAYFQGSEYLRKFFYNNRDPLDRKKFFWEYYVPMISTIYQEYMDKKANLYEGRPLPPKHEDYVPYYRRNNIPLPDVALIASGRKYDPEELLGTRYIEQAYRDSMRRAIESEAARTGYFIGEYGDTFYVEDQQDLSDDLVDSVITTQDTVSFEFRMGKSDSMQRDSAPGGKRASSTGDSGGNRKPAGQSLGFSASRFRVGAGKGDSNLRKRALGDTSRLKIVKVGIPISELEEKDKFRLVLASFDEPMEAQAYLESVDDDQTYIVHFPQQNVYRVVYRSYDERIDAQLMMEKIQTRHKNAWVTFF